jgi:tetratricopeptide (TPR) repeat protein
MADATAYAAVLDGLERYAESEPIYHRALQVFERTYGEDHLDVAGVLHNLAAVRAALGDRWEAEHAYRRALAIKERVAGSESPEAAVTRNNLGRLLVEMGRGGEAEPLLASAVLVLSRTLGPDHLHVRRAVANLQACRNDPSSEVHRPSSEVRGSSFDVTVRADG